MRIDLPCCGFKNCRYCFDGNCTKPSKLEKCEYWYLLHEEPERKKGKWIKEYWNGEHTRKCSACNITQTVTTYRGKVNFNYCPYCGADMRGEEDETD